MLVRLTIVIYGVSRPEWMPVTYYYTLNLYQIPRFFNEKNAFRKNYKNPFKILNKKYVNQK